MSSASWGQVWDWRHQAEVIEILEILKGRVLTGLDGIVVLWLKVERHVLPLKRWAHLLCDYIEAKDPTSDAMEELEDDVIVEWMAELVGTRVMVSAECAVVVFLASRHPDLVSHPLLRFSSCLWLAG